MQYMVKDFVNRWDNGFYYQEKSFASICSFFEGEEDEEVDYLIERVAKLEIGEFYFHEFFGGNSYMFKRIS